MLLSLTKLLHVVIINRFENQYGECLLNAPVLPAAVHVDETSDTAAPATLSPISASPSEYDSTESTSLTPTPATEENQFLSTVTPSPQTPGNDDITEAIVPPHSPTEPANVTPTTSELLVPPSDHNIFKTSSIAPASADGPTQLPIQFPTWSPTSTWSPTPSSDKALSSLMDDQLEDNDDEDRNECSDENPGSDENPCRVEDKDDDNRDKYNDDDDHMANFLTADGPTQIPTWYDDNESWDDDEGEEREACSDENTCPSPGTSSEIWFCNFDSWGPTCEACQITQCLFSGLPFRGILDCDVKCECGMDVACKCNALTNACIQSMRDEDESSFCDQAKAMCCDDDADCKCNFWNTLCKENPGISDDCADKEVNACCEDSDLDCKCRIHDS